MGLPKYHNASSSRAGRVHGMPGQDALGAQTDLPDLPVPSIILWDRFMSGIDDFRATTNAMQSSNQVINKRVELRALNRGWVRPRGQHGPDRGRSCAATAITVMGTLLRAATGLLVRAGDGAALRVLGTR